MPLTRDEWEYLQAYVAQAIALAGMAEDQARPEGEGVQSDDAIPVLVTATVRALDDVQAVAEGLFKCEVITPAPAETSGDTGE